MTIKAAVVQLNSQMEWIDNKPVIEKLLQQAAMDGAEIVVLPENFALFGNLRLREILPDTYPRIVEFLSNTAVDLGLAIVAGSIPCLYTEEGEPVANHRMRAACLVINAKGELVGRYDKIHMFDVQVEDSVQCYQESEKYEPGDRIVVVDIAGLRVGLSICYDLRFPQLYLRLVESGANVIVVPSAFTAVTGRAHWQVLLQARAIESQCYFLAPNQCGDHSGSRVSWGHSMIIDPWGKVKQKLGNEVGVITCDLDLALVEQIRGNMPIQLQCRRFEPYTY